MPFKLTILGSSGALPAYGRYPSAQYINVQRHHFLIDCGEGVQMQLKKFDVPIHKVDRIFISHLHGDHYLGLMGLLFSMHLQKRSNDLHIYSQKGLDEIIILQLKYSKSSLNYKLVFHVVPSAEPDVLFEDEFISVQSIPLTHKIACTGFIVREKIKPRRMDKEALPEGILLQHIAQLKLGKDVFQPDGSILYKNEDYTLPPRPSYTYAYCSDTVYSEEIIPWIKDVDLLYHEATFMTEHANKAAETLHTTALQAAHIAAKAGVKKLILGHFSARYKELDPLLDEARAAFENTQLAIEGETFDLENP